MSVIIERSLLTDNQVTKIVRDLVITPIENGFRKEGKYVTPKALKSVRCFKTIKKGDDVLAIAIPFSYAWKTFKVHNDEKIVFFSIEGKQLLDLRPLQVDVVDACMYRLTNYRTGLVEALPGSGKTTMSTIISLRLGLLTCVLVQNTTLLSQWEEEYKKFTTLTTWVVGDRLRPDVGKFDVIICLIDRYNKVDAETAMQVGTLIIDECPLHCNQKGIDAALHFSPMYMFGLSATPDRSRDGMFSVMENIIGTSKIVMPSNIAIDVVKIETPFEGDRGKNGNASWVEFTQSIMFNGQRNEMLAALAERYVTSGYKVMMITTENNHIELLSEIMKTKNGISHDTYYGKKKSYNNSQVLIAGAKKASIGFDEKNKACVGFDGVRISCVIMCMSMASWENIVQAAGRSFRSLDKKPCVVHIVDNEPVFEKHYRTAESAYNGEHYTPSFSIVSRKKR